MAQTEALGGFTATQHWDGDTHCIDWYAAPRGTPIGWPEGGTVYYLLQVGPDGPDDPLETAILVGDSGNVYSFTHVENIQAGRREAWEQFATVGHSGLASLPGEPDHIHFCVTYQAWPTFGPDGPVGIADPLATLEEMGFGIEIVPTVPGPADYLARRARAGRFI